ncbi:hypothetical protein [Bdellovibrio sp.]|uniref:hypothetical protein n=1 Tax=Bdellovibrio sp. TaxID=28201 RepID=UPI0039E6CC88
MKKQLIKATLFVLASAATTQAHANTTANDLTLIEDLPIEQRAVVHKAVVKFLKNNPEIAAKAKVIAIDRNGVIYVLDENKVFLPLLGEPSCVSM